ncbi:uncharacterized protein MELLADRAFT_109091 [Melampsora larici-populina 98AG31]|uniref:F-box domain-containing protein n=1 Tax=Melampsora larici-populina (strain 98AG31 / pathotype 3-4-7) TaxID=747676 RepID=F4RVA4_MELLP|nr:uncharacterized protein MELLADRAFT_109091 [Melampsora larici-populina 98AG31]EGG03701.1 hypothetical protein MELLADRAFT_109091 [Melampsora larici-populina 98AG31]
MNSADNSFLTITSVKHLLDLRLVSKSWTIAVPPFIYTSLNLKSLWAERAGRHIRLLEYVPVNLNQDPTPIICALQNTLEGLFVTSLPDEIPPTIYNVCFPKLKSLRFMLIDTLASPPIWLEWSFFQTIEVFITSYSDTRDYWYETMTGSNSYLIAQAVNLKKFIFFTGEGEILWDFDLVAAFKAHGIGCCFSTEMSHTEILSCVKELDIEEQQ